MNILFVSDGRYPEYVNGVSIYLHYFCREVVKAGHTVALLHVTNSRLWGKPYLGVSVEDQIRYFNVSDSPLFVGDSLDNPLGNLMQPHLENIFEKVLQQFQPDVVHIHELHRLPASVIDIAQNYDLPVAVSVHDYWFICPLFQLFTPQENICPGPDEGRNCVVTCLAGDRQTRLYRRLSRILAQTPAEKLIRSLRNTYKRIKKQPLWQSARGSVVRKNQHNLRFKRLISDLSAREMGLRQLLSGSDLIHAVSSAAANVFISHGVPAKKVHVVNLGVKAVDWIRPRKKKFASLPLKVGFLGHLGPAKGAQVLIDANRFLGSEGIEIHLFGKGRLEDLQYVQNAADEKNNIVYHGPYNYGNLQGIFDQIHILVIPSLWNETLGLIGLEAQAAGLPVIASAIGGMLDYVEHGVNGYLFDVGDARRLADLLTGFINHPERIEALSENAKAPQNMALHADKMMQLYKHIHRHA